MADNEKVANETGTDRVAVVPALTIAHRREDGEMVILAPGLNPGDMVFLLEHAINEVLRTYSSRRQMSKVVPAASIPPLPLGRH